MNIPAPIALTVFWIFMGILTIFALLQLFHALRFGQRIYRTVFTSALFIGCAIFILWTAFAGLRSIPPTLTIDFGSNITLTPQ